MREQDLVDKLIEKQGNMSDRAFARQLGVSQALWSTTKGRQIPIGKKLIGAALREYPSLADDVLRHFQTPVAASA